MLVNIDKHRKIKPLTLNKAGKKRIVHLIAVRCRNTLTDTTGFALYTVVNIKKWAIEKDTPFLDTFLFKTSKAAFMMGELLLTKGIITKLRKNPPPHSLKGGEANIICNGKLTDGYLNTKIKEFIEQYISPRTKPHNRKLVKSLMAPQCAGLNSSFLSLIKNYLGVEDKKKYVRVAHCLFHHQVFIEEYEALLKHYAGTRVICEMIGFSWLRIVSELEQNATENKDRLTLTLLGHLQKAMKKTYRKALKPFSKQEFEIMVMSN